MLEMVKVDHLYLLEVLFTNVVNTVHSALGYEGFYYGSNETNLYNVVQTSQFLLVSFVLGFLLPPLAR